jgi:hypothetical protein
MVFSLIHHLFDILPHLCDTFASCATNPIHIYKQEMGSYKTESHAYQEASTM